MDHIDVFPIAAATMTVRRTVTATAGTTPEECSCRLLASLCILYLTILKQTFEHFFVSKVHCYCYHSE